MRMAFIVRAGGATFERIVGNEVRGPISVVSSTYQVYEKYYQPKKEKRTKRISRILN